MAEAAICSAPPAVHFSGEMRGKRKTPSELRSEQLKRLQNDRNQATCLSKSNQAAPAMQKQDVPRPPRFVDTRVPDIYPVTKLGDRSSRFPAEKKEVPHLSQSCPEHANRDAGINTVADRARSLAKFQWKGAEESNHTNLGTKPWTAETNPENLHQASKSSSFSTFRDVTQLSTRLQENSPGPTVDMAKAFKGMSASRAVNLNEHSASVPSAIEARQLLSVSKNTAQVKPPSLCIHGNKLPLDLSLKTSIRFTSTASFERFERITNKDLCIGMKSFLSASQGQGGCSDTRPGNLLGNNVEASFAEALHSWIHPQSVLPSSVLSALASSAAHGGASENDFLSKRQLAWEDAFRSLYYMFRNGQCDLFYFSTQQFIAMFIGGGLLQKTKMEFNAYVSRSTRGLRALLQEQDIAFTMPLCSTEVATSIEEIHELTEFEKTHPGQTRIVDSMIAVDNSPQSILLFNGQKSVHGLYDLLLNHRSLLSSTTGADVPVLVSPITFQNASLVMPDVLCRKTQVPVESNVISNEQSKGLSMNTNYSLEVKGGILPPWVIWRVCTAIEQLLPGNFEGSLATDPISGGFNIAQDYTVMDGVEQETVTTSILKKELDALLLSSEMKVGFVRQFKREGGSYAITLSAV